MTHSPRIAVSASPRVLLTQRREVDQPRWYDRIHTVLQPCGLQLCRAHTRWEAIDRVERGGLAAAVLVADDRQIDGLSLLRTIRMIDAGLPCWLVTEDSTRRTLEAAFALKVMSVITHPSGASELGLALRRLMAGGVQGN